MNLHQDLLYNILLQSDVETINALCKTNTKAHQLCNDKQFWIDKFTQEHIEALLIDFEPDDFSYLEWYHYAVKDIVLAKHILKINFIEKTRHYNKTKGIFKVLVEGDVERLQYLFPQLSKDIDFYNEVIFTLLDKEYHLEITYDVVNKIDLGKLTLQQAEHLLPNLIGLTGSITDQHDFDMVYRLDDTIDSNIYNHHIDHHPVHAKVLLIRRGMWEMIN